MVTMSATNTPSQMYRFNTGPFASETNKHNASGYTKFTTKLKRGSGTRDQDVTKVVTKHTDPETAAENHQAAIDAAVKFADNAREIKPGVHNE